MTTFGQGQLGEGKAGERRKGRQDRRTGSTARQRQPRQHRHFGEMLLGRHRSHADRHYPKQ